MRVLPPTGESEADGYIPTRKRGHHRPVRARQFLWRSLSCRGADSRCHGKDYGASVIVRLEKQAMLRVLREEPTFAELFIAFMVTRNIRIQEDLIDQLFN